MNQADAETFGKAMGDLISQEVGAVARRVKALEDAPAPQNPEDLIKDFAGFFCKAFEDHG